jgi:predicted membrane chloride channel (bestrophin family)
MNLTFCNTTAEYEEIVEDPIWHGLEFHHLGLILSAIFGLFSIILSLFLVYQHATHYLKPWEQRQYVGQC